MPRPLLREGRVELRTTDGCRLDAVSLVHDTPGRAAEDVAQFAVWLGVTSAVMFAACLLACIVPAKLQGFHHRTCSFAVIIGWNEQT